MSLAQLQRHGSGQSNREPALAELDRVEISLRPENGLGFADWSAEANANGMFAFQTSRGFNNYFLLKFEVLAHMSKRSVITDCLYEALGLIWFRERGSKFSLIPVRRRSQARCRTMALFYTR